MTDGYVLQQVGVPPSHPPPLLSTFSSKTPWEHGTGTDLLPQAQEVLVWAVGQPLPVPLAQSTAPPPTKPSQTLWTHSLILATWGEALEEALASRASPPPLLERPLPFLQWAPHRGLRHLPSTQEPGSPTQEALSPHGRLVEVVEGGNRKDRVLLRSQSPAPATLPCPTHRPRIDPTTMLASPQWEEAHPAQGEKHRLGWVRSPNPRMPTLTTCCLLRALRGPKRRKGPGL